MADWHLLYQPERGGGVDDERFREAEHVVADLVGVVDHALLDLVDLVQRVLLSALFSQARLQPADD